MSDDHKETDAFNPYILKEEDLKEDDLEINNQKIKKIISDFLPKQDDFHFYAAVKGHLTGTWDHGNQDEMPDRIPQESQDKVPYKIQESSIGTDKSGIAPQIEEMLLKRAFEEQDAQETVADQRPSAQEPQKNACGNVVDDGENTEAIDIHMDDLNFSDTLDRYRQAQEDLEDRLKDYWSVSDDKEGIKSFEIELSPGTRERCKNLHNNMEELAIREISKRFSEIQDTHDETTRETEGDQRPAEQEPPRNACGDVVGPDGLPLINEKAFDDFKHRF